MERGAPEVGDERQQIAGLGAWPQQGRQETSAPEKSRGSPVPQWYQQPRTAAPALHAIDDLRVAAVAFAVFGLIAWDVNAADGTRWLVRGYHSLRTQ